LALLLSFGFGVAALPFQGWPNSMVVTKKVHASQMDSKGTVALSVDIITVQEIFRLAVAPSAHAAVLSD